MNHDEMGEILDRIEAKAVETQRHFDVVAEGLNANIQRVAEGHGVLIKKIDGLGTRMDGLDTHMDGLETRMGGLETRMGGLESHMEGTETKLDAFIEETRTNFGEVRAAIKFSYAELDRRVAHLESFVLDLSERLQRLESSQTA